MGGNRSPLFSFVKNIACIKGVVYLKKEIYLDNAATTRSLETVIESVTSVMRESYGNPSSLHKKGMQAENLVKDSSECLSKILGCAKEEIIYTSGGTESNNLAILGTAYAYEKRGKKIITTAIEHPSVGQVFEHLENKGFEVAILEVDEMGYINYSQLEEEVDEETILVSIMHVNNEIGTVQNLEKIGEIIKSKNPNTVFHVDAIQSFSKVPITLKRSKIDLLSISGHKFYAPKGIGVLYKNKAIRIINILHGGGQQKNLRSGTENVPGVVGIHAAAEYVYKNFNDLTTHYRECKTYLFNQTKEKIDRIYLNGPALEEGAPHILNIAFEDVRAEVLLHALEQYGIYVSSGSACSSNKVNPKGTLYAIGKQGQGLDNAIRFSFSHETTKEDLDEVVSVLESQIRLLRKFTLGGKK